MVIFAPPRQDPGSAVLNMLELLQASARDPDEEGITVVQPGGDKGMDQPLSIRFGEERAEFGNVFKVEEGNLTEVADVGVQCEI